VRRGLRRGEVFPAERAESLLNPLRHLVQSPRRTVAAIGLAADDRVLEIGSGPGYFSRALSDAVPAGHLVLVDLQPEMLNVAQRRLAGRFNTSLVAGDGRTLPLAPPFDVVFLATVLGEVGSPERCLGELRRVLRPQGLLVVAETRRDSDFISLSALRELLERHGFTYVDHRGPRWQYVARFRRV
jgi:ubiquinone/menaquinone biosynthesis C-methylase UbiE